MKLFLQARRIGGAASIALEMAGRLSLLRALEEAPDLRVRGRVLQQVSRLLLHVHDIEVSEHGTRPAGAVLLVSNHVSWLDPLVIMSAHPVLPLAKAELRRWPLIGPLCERAGVQFVARGTTASGISALRTMARALASGASILNFPEGTTTRGERVLPLKAGCFGAARIADVPVVPVAIRWDSSELSWTGDESFVPHYLAVTARDRIYVRLRWGKALSPSHFANDREVAEQARDFLARAIEEPLNAAAERA